MKHKKINGHRCPACLTLRREASRLIVRSESERAQVARRLHDDLGQKLTVVGMELSLWRDELSARRRVPVAAVRARIGRLSELVEAMVGGARSLSGALRSRSVEVFGLAGAMEARWANLLHRTGMQGCLRVPEERMAVDGLAAVQFFRVFEAVIEACGSAPGCRRMDAAVTATLRRITLAIRCNGATAALPREAAALARVLGGRAVCHGATLRVWLPAVLPVG
jgi:two-component system sensor histidine kinase UhpB